jgi:small-conductance mechanosensitive channel
MKEFVLNYFHSVQSPIIKAFLLFAVYLVLAKIIDFFIDKVVRRTTKFTKTEIDDRIIDLSHRPLFITIVIIGAIHSMTVLNLSENYLFFIKGFSFTVLVFTWGIYLIRISNMVIKNSVHRVADITGLGREVAPLIENIWKVIVIIAVLMIVLSLWKIDITPLMASAGIAGVAVALAAKDTLANFFGGISIFLDKPYKIGDYIVLDSGERGEVVDIGIRSTRIKTRDDILISIPNSIIANTKIINESAPIPHFRVRIPVSVAYGSDIHKVENILLAIARENKNILTDPEPRVRFRTFGESSLDFELLCWAKEPVMRGLTIHEMNKTIYDKFNDEGVTIPFPHRTVYVREEKNWET